MRRDDILWITEDLGKCSKDELVILYVAARYQTAVFASNTIRLSRFQIEGTGDDDLVRKPSEEWLRRIAKYCWEHREPDDLDYGGYDLEDYGVDDEDALKVFDRMVREGELGMPYGYDYEESPLHDKFLEYERRELERRVWIPWHGDRPPIQGDWDELSMLPRERLIGMIERLRREYSGLREESRRLEMRYSYLYWRLAPPGSGFLYESSDNEWTMLERVPKEDLVIETVRMQTLYGMLYHKDRGYPLPPPDIFGARGNPSPEWLERIAGYAAKLREGKKVRKRDLRYCGLSEAQVRRAMELLKSGRPGRTTPPATTRRESVLRLNGSACSVPRRRTGRPGMRAISGDDAWSGLYRLPKDELVIELVRARNLYGLLREDLGDECRLPYVEPAHHYIDGAYIEGFPATEQWAERIALYAVSHPEDGSFYYGDLMNYGMTYDQSYDTCQSLYREGRLKGPDGIRIIDDYGDGTDLGWETWRESDMPEEG